jgi:hypothetical protein
MLKNILEPGSPQMTLWRMCTACCIPKATNSHSEYVILIAFSLQQWLHDPLQYAVMRTVPVLLLWGNVWTEEILSDWGTKSMFVESC